MAKRIENRATVYIDNNKAVEIYSVDKIIIDDILIQGAKIFGYKLVTGSDAAVPIDKTIKDYLVKLKVHME